MTELCYMPATEALRLFRTRELSPVDLLDAQVERIRAINPEVNAIVENYFDESYDLAHKAEAAYMRGEQRPLEGLTVAVKDEHNIEGRSLPHGSLLFRDAVSTYTDPICERLAGAGAIVHARSAAPEFSANYTTWSKLRGVTRNPWNLEYTVGGSSGGSGAALAAGFCSLATGSDVGGSIRSPASQNGVAGYKPPHGRVPKYPPSNLVHYYSDGPMARNVGDLILMENVIAGPHRCDMNSLKPKVDLATSYPPVKGMKLAFSIDMGGKAVDPDVRSNTLETVSRLRSLGASVEEIDIGWDEAKANHTAVIYLGFILGGFIDQKIRDDSRFDELATSYVRYFVAAGRTITRDDFIGALSYETFMYDCIQKVFDRYEALICPTVSIASVSAEFDYSKDVLLVDGKQETPVFGPYMTHYFNTLSRCPALSVPSGLDRNGVPTGIQIVGPAYEEEPVFRVATALEQQSLLGFFSQLLPPVGQARAATP